MSSLRDAALSTAVGLLAALAASYLLFGVENLVPEELWPLGILFGGMVLLTPFTGPLAGGIAWALLIKAENADPSLPRIAALAVLTLVLLPLPMASVVVVLTWRLSYVVLAAGFCVVVGFVPLAGAAALLFRREGRRRRSSDALP